MNEDIIETLNKIGLTKYESLAFYYLNSMIEAKAPEISEKSKIPRTKIYTVLKSLEKKGFIEINKGHPNIYKSIDPSIIFKRERKKINDELKNAELELVYNHENQTIKTQAPMWLIRGEKKIVNKEIELIKKAKTHVNMRIGFLFEEEIQQLKNTLKNKSESIDINILASPYCIINNKKVNIKEELENPNINIYNTDLPYVKMMICDGKEMLHIYSKFNEKTRSPINETSIAMWNQYPEICKNYDDRYYKILKKIKNKSTNTKNNTHKQ